MNLFSDLKSCQKGIFVCTNKDLASCAVSVPMATEEMNIRDFKSEKFHFQYDLLKTIKSFLSFCSFSTAHHKKKHLPITRILHSKAKCLILLEYNLEI